jgi:Na+-transporting NADH:ubiquinone oxidoreductase subunit NqrC
MSTELVTQQQQAVQQWKSPSQIKQRIEAIQVLMTQVLKKDTDFGIIPGMPKGTKPSLWKPGSEQILAMFQIACEPVVEDLSVEDCYRYRVTTRLTNVQTGEFLGAGIGEASTDETKYKWKACYSKAEFDATDPGRRRMKYSSWQGKDTEQMQVRQEPADLANTILKMAKKRSQIDATLTVTGASSMFEQDLEDLPEETRQEMARQRGGKKKAETAPVGDTMCGECRQVNAHHPLCKYFKGTPPAAAQVAPAEATPVQPQETTTQTVEPPQKPSNTKMAVKINSVSERSKVKDGNKQIYLVLGVVDPNNDEWDLYVWHKTLQERAATLANRSALIEFSQKTSNGRTYCSLEAILEVVGEQASEPDDDF